VDSLAVRHSVESDFDAWLALFEEVAGEGRWIGAEAPVDRDRARQVFDARLDSTHAATFIAETDGVLIGHLGVDLTAGVADLGMMVRDTDRGQGVGSRLLEACIDWSRAKGAHKVTLSVWPHNERAIRLYENHGFVVEGRLRRQWRRRNGELWDVLLMGLVLNTSSLGSPHN
jgi:putative acetyltransferase